MEGYSAVKSTTEVNIVTTSQFINLYTLFSYIDNQQRK